MTKRLTHRTTSKDWIFGGKKVRVIDIGVSEEKRVGFICDLCGKNLENSEELVLENNIWDEVCMKIPDRKYIPRHTLLCPDCIEKLLGRKPGVSDLKIYPINYWYLRKNGLLKESELRIFKTIKSCPKKSKSSFSDCKRIWLDYIEAYMPLENKDPYEETLKQKITEL